MPPDITTIRFTVSYPGTNKRPIRIPGYFPSGYISQLNGLITGFMKWTENF